MPEGKISVIMPAYNGGKYLSEAVAALRRQTVKPLEIIVVDDGSADNTVDLALSLGLTVLRQDHGGAAKARNRGIAAAKGAYLFLLDCDDIPADDALAGLSELLEKDGGLGAVFGKAQDFVSPELTEEQKSQLRPRTESYGGVLPGCALIRREVFDTVGPFNENLTSGETVAWLMALRDKKIPTAQTEQVTLRRRLHLTNTGRVQKADERANYAAILRARMKEKMAQKKEG